MAPDPEAFKRNFFTEIAPNYAQITGNATKDVFATILNQHDLGISSESVVHDSAAGPGTATEALLPWCSSHGVKPRIVATDYVPAMIEALERLKVQRKDESPLWAEVDTKVLDAADLSAFGDNTFTHTICNFSLATFASPEQSLREIYRTTGPSGTAVFTAWKRFPLSDILEFAQDYVKGTDWGSEHRVPVNGPLFLEKGYMANMICEAGWQEAKVKEVEVSKAIPEGEDWDGLYNFLTKSSIKQGATKGWTEEEHQKWPEAVKEAMLKEKSDFGGVFFEAWTVLASR